jgi:hypothetical protein
MSLIIRAGVFMTRRPQQILESLLSPKVALAILCLDDSIGIGHHKVVGFKLERPRSESRPTGMPAADSR